MPLTINCDTHIFDVPNVVSCEQCKREVFYKNAIPAFGKYFCQAHCLAEYIADGEAMNVASSYQRRPPYYAS